MSIKIINNIKYIKTLDDNNFKKISLEDNIYFTLRDIFANISTIDYFLHTNKLNNILTNNICYEDRTCDFKYANMLNNKSFIIELRKLLKRIMIPYDFDIIKLCDDFTDDEKNEYNNITNWIIFDEWITQFNELKNIIDNKYNELCF